MALVYMSNANLCQKIMRVFLQGIARGILDVLQNVVSNLFSLLRNSSFRLYPWSHISLISLDAASTKYSLLVNDMQNGIIEFAGQHICNLWKQLFQYGGTFYTRLGQAYYPVYRTS